MGRPARQVDERKLPEKPLFLTGLDDELKDAVGPTAGKDGDHIPAVESTNPPCFLKNHQYYFMNTFKQWMGPKTFFNSQ